MKDSKKKFDSQKEKENEKVDWDLLLMMFVLVMSLMFKMATEPPETIAKEEGVEATVAIEDTVNDTQVEVAEAEEEKDIWQEVLEIVVPNYASNLSKEKEIQENITNIEENSTNTNIEENSTNTEIEESNNNTIIDNTSSEITDTQAVVTCPNCGYHIQLNQPQQ